MRAIDYGILAAFFSESLMPYKIKTLIIGIAFLASTLACATITTIFSTEKQTNYLPTFVSTSIPSIEPPTIAPPAMTPTVLASCPATLTEIMTTATGLEEVAQLTSTSDEETFIVTYEVNGDQIGNPYYETVTPDLQDEQNDSATHQNIWDYFIALIPQSQRQIVAEYSIITDGQKNLLAAVAQTAYDPNLWVLEVDITDAVDKANLTYTLVHESGHLLTLSPAQVPPSLAIYNNPDDNEIYLQEVGACPNYFPGEGCSQPGSYINAFFNRFWPDIHEEWQQISLIEDENQYFEELDNFYRAHRDQFVTDYAVTSPEEDIAESWSFFVLSSMSAGNTIAEQKTLFFYAYPELVQLRNEILNNLCAVYQ
jgi:hypothetical protein